MTSTWPGPNYIALLYAAACVSLFLFNDATLIRVAVIASLGMSCAAYAALHLGTERAIALALRVVWGVALTALVALFLAYWRLGGSAVEGAPYYLTSGKARTTVSPLVYHLVAGLEILVAASWPAGFILGSHESPEDQHPAAPRDTPHEGN
jgi:hypothetical protein